MFERYTERARRVLFFARYEASQLGSVSIETEHLLLGLMREGKGLTGRIFARAHLSPDNVRKEVEGRTVYREKVSTSVEIPFNAEVKRVLTFAAEEADRLINDYIGTEHLLLGILREERSVAATILMDKGMRLHTVREDIVQLLNDKNIAPTQTTRPDATTPRFVPSLIVHIAYSTVQSPGIETTGTAWGAYGFTLAQIVAHAWGADEAHVRIEAPAVDVRRYDFMIVLPPSDSPEIIPGLLREAIQEQLDVSVTREDGDPPTLTVRPR
jgi:ATP-dependent Clp protease ATP-binding subunit ClpA